MTLTTIVFCMRLDDNFADHFFAACPARRWLVAVSAIISSPFCRCAHVALARENGVDARDIFAQPANLLQALGLSHVELEFQLEQLVG